ncbi:MAG: ArnT family glycosyltransferase [Isosphaeraceae bacterium]
MAEPISPDHAVPGPARAGRWWHALGRMASLVLVLEIAMALRVVAADALEWYVRRGDSTQLCLFLDTVGYWELARTIRAGGPYEIVDWADIPHFAVRTPGYPLMLAACQAAFGERTLPVRLVQAVLGTLCVYLIYLLARQFARGGDSQAEPDGPTMPGRWTVPLVAAAIAAVNPHYLVMSSLILSEAAFEPLMLASLLGLAVLWPASSSGRKAMLIALGTGASAGAAILVRPSWALFVPAMLAAWIVASLGDRRRLAASMRGTVLCTVGVVAMMGPWWARNMQVYGRFVPTALWMGASLYDGLNPRATGGSDMSFLADPEIWPLDEQDQDAELTRLAVDFARDHPLRVLVLAVSKFGRYWSPWPNAQGFRSPILAVASTVVELPLFGLIAVGLWGRRRDARAWVILAGPLLYFCALHMVFASSMRYRIPGEMPGLGLAALGWARLARGRSFW